MSSVLVVGSGVAGLQASVDLAGFGHQVFLLEKEDELGGNLRNLSEISPGHQEASKLLSLYLSRIRETSNITVLKNAEVLDFSGSFPKFEASIKADSKKTNLAFGAVVLATGMRPFNPSSLKLYRYGIFKDVITTLELERMLKEGKLVRPSNLQKPKTVAIIQCVGSRDCKVNDYCSDFCCNNSVKLAQIVRKQDPSVKVSVFHIDMRTPYEGELEFKKARSQGIRFPRGKPARIRENKDDLTIEAEDTLENDLVYQSFDLAVLSIGGVPDPTVKSLAEKLQVNISDSGFFVTDNRALSTSVNGIFAAGAACGPKDIAYSMIQGSCAAVRVDACLRDLHK